MVHAKIRKSFSTRRPTDTVRLLSLKSHSHIFWLPCSFFNDEKAFISLACTEVSPPDTNKVCNFVTSQLAYPIKHLCLNVYCHDSASRSCSGQQCRVFFAMRGAAVIVKCLKCKYVLTQFTQLALTVLHLLHIAQFMLEQDAIYVLHKNISSD